MIEQDSYQNPDQNIRKPVLVVGWHPVDYERIGALSASYTEVDIDEDELIDKEIFPSIEHFPPQAMRRWCRDEDLAHPEGGNHHWAYVLSLKELFTHLTDIDFDDPLEEDDVTAEAGTGGDDDSGSTSESEVETEDGRSR